MSTHDMDLANATGAAFRADANLALVALASNSTSTTALVPTTTFPNQWWADTTAMILKRRNNANDAWINVMSLATGLIIGTDVQAYSANIVQKNVANAFTATQTPDNGTGTITSSATYTFDGADQVREITLTNAETVTFGAPTGITEFAMYVFKLKAGDTSARTYAWNAAFKFPGAAPTLATATATTGAKDIITFIGGPSNVLEYLGHQADVR